MYHPNANYTFVSTAFTSSGFDGSNGSAKSVLRVHPINPP